MWAHIQDEEVLEECVGVPVEWWTPIRRVAVAGETMTSQFPPRLGGPSASGAPPTNTGHGGGSLGHHECRCFVCTGLGARFCIGFLIPTFVLIGVRGFMGLRAIVHVYFVNTDDLHDIYMDIFFDHACLYALCFYV
jgi:hypothetical protein